MTDDRVIDYVANRLLKSWFPSSKIIPFEEWKEAARDDAEVAIQAYLEYTSDDYK